MMKDQARPHDNEAFSLIEIMIASALGAFILLLAIMAVRTSTDALRSLEAQSQTNDALRLGWMALVDDLDHWRSHGDPEYPYGRNLARENSHGADEHKRLFRQMAAIPANARSGMIDPSGPGAYIIHAPMPAVVGFNTARAPHSGRIEDLSIFEQGEWEANPALKASEWRLMSTVWEGTDPLTSFNLTLHDFVDTEPGGGWDFESDSSTRDIDPHVTGSDGLLYISYVMPKGWNPWNIIGDFPNLANHDELLGGRVDLNDSARPAHLQAVQRHAFRNLGHHGVASYAPPGTGNMIAAPPRNRDNLTVWSAAGTADQRRVLQGEIPSALTGLPRDPLGTPGAEDDYLSGMPGTHMGVRMTHLPTAWNHDGYSRATRGSASNTGNHVTNADYIKSLGTTSLFLGEHSWGGKLSGLWVNTTPPTNLWSSNLKFMMIDYDRATGHSVSHLAFPSAPHGFIYAARAEFDGSGWRASRTWDDWYRDPQRRLWADEVVNTSGTDPREVRSRRFREALHFYSGRSKHMMLVPHIIWTDHLPSAPSDALINPQSLSGEKLRLRTGVVRWRQEGRDKNVGWVEVNDGSEQPITMALPMLTSSWRGARLQWGRD